MSAPSPQLATMGPRFGIIGAFAVIYSIWGTTYLAIALSLETLPPFLSGASRFLLAASILGVWLGIRSPGNFRGVPLTRAIVVGVLLTGVGNGLVVYAQQGVPSGIAALFVSAIPGLVLLLDAAFFTRRAPPVVPLTGVCVALAGIGLLSGDLANLSDSVSWRHLVALLIAATGWSLGTLLQRGSAASASLLAFTCVQMAAGGGFQLLLATTTGEVTDFNWHRVSLVSALAVLYLVVFGSIIAFNCYLWLLGRVDASAVTTYALVNPILALVLGSLVMGERLTPQAFGAALCVLTGVALILFHGVRLRRRRAMRTATTSGNTSV